MNPWETYTSRINAIGPTKRDSTLKRELRFLDSKMRESLSHHSVEIDGVPQEVSIINTDNLNEKFIFSMPGKDIACGGLVFWEDNYWLITERDAANEVCTRGILLQCNYLLRWVDDSANIHEQWCVIEDGTKYLTGEYEDRGYIVTRGDSRLGMTIAKNEFTTKLRRGNRFLIDDNGDDTLIAYELTKPLKVGRVYNGAGVYKFVLQEVNSTEYDNHVQRIADYYKYFPKETGTPESDVTTPDTTIDPNKVGEDGKKVWL